MTAVLIPTANEAEWLETRRQGVTASEIAIIMGLSPYSSPYALYHQKLGILAPPEQTEEQEVGHVLEPYIARKFAGRHPEFIVDGNGRELFTHSERPWQMATPDRLLVSYEVEPETNGTIPIDTVGVLECKSDNGCDEWGEPGTDEIPVHYRCQVIWQMDVMGVSTAYPVCLGRDRKVREYVLEHDPAVRLGYDVTHTLEATGELCGLCGDILMMRVAATEFMERLDRQEPPDVDWRPATLSTLRALYSGPGETDVVIGRQMAISYRAAVKRYKAAERRKDEMTARVLQAIGGGRRAIEANTDLPVATRSVSHPKRVSSTLLRERYPAIAAECTPDPKPVVKLDPAKPKKEKTP